MSQNQLQKFILQELNRHKREGVVLEDPIKYIEKFIGPDYFLHFTNINKLGINPQYQHHTPAGIYSYPLEQKIFNELAEDRIDYASDYKYLILFRKITDDKIYDFEIDDITDDELERKIMVARNLINFHYLDEGGRNPVTNLQTFFQLVQNSSLRPLQKRKIFLACEIDGLIDRGESFITNDIAAQAVFFNISKIEIQQVMKNPLLKEKLYQAIADNSALSSNTRKNLPQNINDKIINDPFADDYQKEANFRYASEHALVKFIHFEPKNHLSGGLKLKAFEQLTLRFPEKAIPYFYRSNREFRMTLYRRIDIKILNKEFSKIIAFEDLNLLLAEAVNRVDSQLLDELVPLFPELKDRNRWQDLYFALEDRKEGDGIFMAELQKFR